MSLVVVLVSTAVLAVLLGFLRPDTPAKQVILSTLLVALLIPGMLWPLAQQSYLAKVAHAVEGPLNDWQSKIGNYDASYRVTAHGRLEATEVLTVDLAAGRHGIFRFFPVADPTDPHARMIPTVTGVTMDHRPVPVSYSWRDARTVYVAQIGDPDATVSPGAHTYTINYAIDAALVKPPAAPGSFTSRAGHNPAPPTAAFYYNVVGFWAMKIDAAQVRIDLPGPSGMVQCAADETGVTPCAVEGAGTDRVTVTTDSLPPQNPVTVRVDLQVPLPDRATLPWTVRFDKILGRSLPMARLVALLSMLGALLGYLWARRSREPPPGMPVLYVPPDGLGPAQTVYVVKETVGKHALVATLLYLAERGLVRLSGAGSRNWKITGAGTAEEWAAVDPVTRKVGEALGITTADAVFRANGSVTAGKKLTTATEGLKSSCASWARAEGVAAPAVWERVGRMAEGTALVLAVVGFSGLFGLTMWGLPFAAFAIAGIGLLATGVGSRRTRSGRRLWSRAGGLERLLATPSSEGRFDFAARTDLFTAYIPYAVAFGVADRWAAKYRTATGEDPPAPSWYPVGSSGGGAAKLYSANGLAGFDSAVSASISAYRSSQSSSSSSGGSSFSSSGGSWGGGGGGGGGTW